MELYKVIEPKSMDSLGCWEQHIPNYDQVIGYSVLGHIFIFNTETNEYAVVHPYQKSMKQYGSFESFAAFETQIIQDPEFVDYVFRPEHSQDVQAFVGPLENEEVYYPCPYTFIGGSGEVSTYSKGNVWVFMEVVGQTHGFQ